MKTVVKQILDNRDKNFDANKFIKWLDENRHNLLHLEEIQFNNAYNSGVQDRIMDVVKINNEYYSENYQQ